MEFPLESFLSAVAGCGLSSILVKIFISKTLEELSNVTDKLGTIQAHLAALSANIDAMNEHKYILREHDKKIAALEAQIGCDDE